MNTTPPQASVEDIVQRQLDAYNAKDIDAFMAVWSGDARYFAFPSTLLASGAAAIRARHVERFREPGLFGKLIKRMVAGNVVVDQESVTRTFPDGPGRIDVIAIYEVEHGKIAAAWFKMGEPILDPKG
jgi:putative hydrolase of HD superfamily